MQPALQAAIDSTLTHTAPDAAELPRIDLYMDQILTLFDEGFSQNEQGEHILTKTMINNYSKEHLILPIKGKKYTREQVMQLLCIVCMKPVLPLSDIKRLMSASGSKPVNFEGCYQQARTQKEALRAQLPALITQALGGADLPDDPNWELTAALTLCSLADDLRRISAALAAGRDLPPAPGKASHPT